MKFWTKWCKMVENHNKDLGYVCQEETWSPFMIFAPIIVALLEVGAIMLMAFLCNVPLQAILMVAIKGAIISFVITSLFLILNWKAYSTP